MNRWLKTALIAPLALGFASCNWLGFGVGVTCDKKMLREYPSPSGSRKAVLYENVCGDTSISNYVQVELAGTSNIEGAPVMYAFRTDQASPPPADLTFEWKSDAELWIVYPPKAHTSCMTSGSDVAVHCVDSEVAARVAPRSN